MSTTPQAPQSRALLLSRARTYFVRFVLLAAGVQLLEVVDAQTAVWPHRTAALVGTAAIVAWAVRVGRTQRVTPLGDAAIILAIVAIGLGLGRNGAVLVSLIAVLPLRALLGRRRDVAAAACGVFAAYAFVTVVLGGGGALLDLGIPVVLGASSAFAWTLRRVGELLASHDLRVRLDEVATNAAAHLLATSSTSEVEAVRGWAREQVRLVADDRSVRDAPGVVATVQRRLAADVHLARQRIATEARYRTVAEGSRDGLYLRDAPVPGPDARYTYLNPAAETILGVAVADLIADPSIVRHLMHEDDHHLLTAAIDADGLIAQPAEIRWHRPDGQVRWIRLQERVVEVDGERRTVLGMLRDVTRQHEEASALKRVVERERAAADELRHLDAMKSTFLQAVSHELRTPLSAVIGAAQTLDARDAQLDAEQRRRMLDIVQRQSARLERLLTDLLDVDRLSRGLVAPDLAPTDLRDLVMGVVATLERDEAARIEVVGPPTVLDVDAPKVERIVDNLLRNALRHTPQGSRVVCRLAVGPDGAELTVEDEGPGIPDELKTDVFQPFTQGPSAQVAPSPGTGIGLSLVRALAELHGGSVRIEDPPDGGARFVVRLPAAGAPGATVRRAGEGPGRIPPADVVTA